MTMNTMIKFLLAFLSLFFQFYSSYATSFLAARKPRPKKPQGGGGKKPTPAGKPKRKRRPRKKRSERPTVTSNKPRNLPRIEQKDATFLMRSEAFEDTLKKVQSSLVAQSITGRLTCPVPDGSGKRIMVNPLVTSFPINGNTDTGEPSMVDNNGHLSLIIKPSLRDTVVARKARQAGAAEQFQNTNPVFDSSHTYSGQSGQHLVVVAGASSYTSIVNKGTSKADVMIDGNNHKVWFGPECPSVSTTSVYSPNITIASGSNTLNVDEANSGFVLKTGDIITWTVGATCALNTWSIGFLNLTAGTEIATSTVSNGRATTSITVGTTSGFTTGDRVLPIILQGTAGNMLVTAMSISIIVSAGSTDYVNISFDMAAADEDLWLSTFKKSRITSFCVWLQNTSNPTKVAGQLAGFWLNPDQAADFDLQSPGSLISQASSLTRDTKVVPWNKGFYTFERIKEEMLVFQPSLDMDSGYRLVIGGLPSFTETTDVQGFLHVFMTVESECESRILKAPIPPDSPNAIALWKSAMANIPNNCMENAQHVSILKSIMKGVRGIANIPWVRDALNAMGSAAIDSLANSAYNSLPQQMPLSTYSQDYARRQY